MESDGLPVRVQVGGQPYLRFRGQAMPLSCWKSLEGRAVFARAVASRHLRRRCAAGSGFEEVRGVCAEASGHQTPGPGPQWATAFCSSALWPSRGLPGLGRERCLACGRGGPRCQGPWGGREDGDLLPLSGPGARHQRSLPGEAGPAATTFCLSDRPSVRRRLWFLAWGNVWAPPSEALMLCCLSSRAGLRR